jgi:alpha-tubulin suppressor-like RCC1 family protein
LARLVVGLTDVAWRMNSDANGRFFAWASLAALFGCATGGAGSAPGIDGDGASSGGDGGSPSMAVGSGGGGAGSSSGAGGASPQDPPPVRRVIACGGAFTCALTSAGGAKCWGKNGFGELGDGSNFGSGVPVDVVGLGSALVSITAGENHACGLTERGAVHCWGWNHDGQLGNGTHEDSNIPVAVAGLPEDIVAIAAGARHNCAMTSAGGLRCWGYGSAGQLGDGLKATSTVPVPVIGLGSDVLAVDPGFSHTCALTSQGVACWGSNYYGQLGNGTNVPSPTPSGVVDLDGSFVALSSTYAHSCVVGAAGTVHCWGRNMEGQLGAGATDSTSNVPVVVATADVNPLDVASGEFHTCILTSAGSIHCWGWNEWGQLGDGSTTPRSTPVQVVGLESGVDLVASGGGHSCARKKQHLRCWGANNFGQLGNGRPMDSSVPVDVVGF